MSGTDSLVICCDSANADLFTSGSFYLPTLGQSTARANSSPTAKIELAANSAYTVSKLACNANVNTYSGGSTAVIDFQKNGSNGNLSVVCTGAGTGWIVDATHSDTLAANDLFNSVFTANSGGPDFKAYIFQAMFNCSTPNTVYGNTGNYNIPSTVKYFNIFGSTGEQAVEAGPPQTYVQGPGTLSQMSVYLSAVTGTFTAAFRKNGGAGNGSLSTSSTGIVTDATHSDGIAAADLINTSQIAGTTATGEWGSFNFAGSTSQNDTGCSSSSTGESITNGGTFYFYIGGLTPSSANTTETQFQHTIPFAATASALRAACNSAGGTSTITSRVASAGGNMSAVVTTTGWTKDATHSDVLSANAVFGVKAVGSVGTNNINTIFLSLDDGSVAPSTGTFRHQLLNR